MVEPRVVIPLTLVRFQARTPIMNTKLLRDVTLRLFQQLHQDDGYFYRASGSMYCKHCGLQYRYHPVEELHNTDHRLCNGDIVHL